MSLLLCLKQPLEHWVDMSRLDWQAMTDLSLDSIRSLRLDSKLGPLTIDDCFLVDGNSEQRRATIVGDCRLVHGLGTRLSDYELTVEGNAGDFLATDMRGGVIKVRGSAGDGVGRPSRGRRSGMRGGLVLISGDAGRGLGHRMRRGTIIVGGSVGAACGTEMVAGTIAVAAADAADFGLGMKRGTIICDRLPGLSSFSPPFPVPAVIFRLTADYLRDQLILHGEPVEWITGNLQSLYNSGRAPESNVRWWRRLGDKSVAGMGEIWYRTTKL